METGYWSRRIRRRSAIAAGAATLFAAACGGSGNNTKNAATSQSTSASAPAGGPAVASATQRAATAASPQAAGAAQPRKGGTIRYSLADEVPHLDPHQLLNATKYSITQPLYCGLLRPKFGADAVPNELVLTPEMAESYQNPDPTTFIFKLRQGVMFHKNQWNKDDVELTAEDVAFNIERMRRSDAVRPYYWDPEVVKVETPDKYTVRITTAHPYAPLLSYVASMDAHLAPKKVLAANDDALKDGAVGTGAFMLDRHTKDQEYRLVRNPGYYRPGLPYADDVVMTIIRDTAATQAAFTTGQIHFYLSFTPQEKDSILAQVEGAQNQEVLSGSGTTLRMVSTRKPFDDIRVREAMLLGLDRPALLQALAAGKGKYNGPVPAGMQSWALADPLNTLPFMKRDLQKGKQLLTAAGYADGKGLKFEFPAWNLPSQLRPSELAAAQLRELGVEISMKLVDHVQYNQLQAESNYDLFYTNRIPYWDPDEHMYGRYYSKSPLNEAKANDPNIDALMLKQRTLLDAKERKAFLDDAQLKVAEQAYWGYTWDSNVFSLVHPNIQGFYAHVYGNGTRQFDETWLKS